MSRDENEEDKVSENSDSKTDNGENAPPQSIDVNGETAKKVVYSLCYLWGILFFLPLILYKNDKAAIRHANEGLVLLLFSVIGNAVFGILTSLGSFFAKVFGIIAGVYSLLLLLLGIIGIVYVVTDNQNELPIVGAIRILK